ncbi:hypothetical protein SASPL_128475 [Salvia splendens]|uniref:Uncharacterized protein n=1 Tax=Salvia splendens TaxID=180675 RepID=A0A8X8XFB4_SALSN|nr:hypothetical protein SASPL_128475 [Salvia splendens]
MGPQHLQAGERVPVDRHGEARRSPHLRADGSRAIVYGTTRPDRPDTKLAVAHVNQGDAAFSVGPILRETNVLRGPGGGGHVPGEPTRGGRAGEGTWFEAEELRFFHGYCAWEREQLSDEIRAGYWTVAACSPTVIQEATVGLWEEISGLMGPTRVCPVDGWGRNHGERTGLNTITLVVHAIKDECSPLVYAQVPANAGNTRPGPKL